MVLRRKRYTKWLVTVAASLASRKPKQYTQEWFNGYTEINWLNGLRSGLVNFWFWFLFHKYPLISCTVCSFRSCRICRSRRYVAGLLLVGRPDGVYSCWHIMMLLLWLLKWSWWLIWNRIITSAWIVIIATERIFTNYRWSGGDVIFWDFLINLLMIESYKASVRRITWWRG